MLPIFIPCVSHVFRLEFLLLFLLRDPFVLYSLYARSVFLCYFPYFIFLSTGVACAGSPVLSVVCLALALGMWLRVKAHAVAPRVKAHAAVLPVVSR